MPAPKENQNAAKPQAEKASSFLHIRAVPRDKAGWVRAAALRQQKLAEWVTAALNRASR